MNIIVWIICASIIAVLPSLLIKQYIITSNIKYLVFAAVFYCMLIYFYVNIFKRSALSTSHALSQILQIILVVGISTFFYKEKINKFKIFGLLLAFGAIYCLMKK
jgi:multidrug transporter EmrE-like cation transporter